MAATTKSAKQSAGKKRSTTTRKGSGRTAKKSARSTSKKPGRKKATLLERKARKGLGAARDGFDSVLEAGSKTWRTLKKTTTLMMEGVKETLAGEPDTGAPRRRRR